MPHNIKQAVESVIDHYTKTHKVYGRGNEFYYNSYPNLEKRLIYILDKIIVPYKRHPELFNNKSILDFGCGTGEHSYFLSHFADTITLLIHKLYTIIGLILCLMGQIKLM